MLESIVGAGEQIKNLIADAEKQFTEKGKGKEKLNWVVQNVVDRKILNIRWIPDWIEKSIYPVICQIVFDAVKSYVEE